MADPDRSVVGGGGTTEREDSAARGGGGMADRCSAVLGGGGIAEQEASRVRGGGGMADPDRAVRGGGGIAEQDSAVLGGGGINDPERSGLDAPADSLRPGTPADRAALAPDSILPIVRLGGRVGKSWPAALQDVDGPGVHVSSASSEVHTTTRVRSPRNRSLANSSGSPERA